MCDNNYKTHLWGNPKIYDVQYLHNEIHVDQVSNIFVPHSVTAAKLIHGLKHTIDLCVWVQNVQPQSSNKN